VGIAPDYRVRAEAMKAPAATLADAVSDGRQALAFVQTHAAEYGIDPRRIVLAGGSAGGILTLNLVHTASGPLEGVVGIVNLWGTPGGDWRRFEQVRPDSPATFTVHGTADALVPYQYSQTFNDDLERAGVPHVFLTLPAAPHTPLMHFDQIVAAVAQFLQETIDQ
jgi:acetyl esterase/lipase